MKMPDTFRIKGTQPNYSSIIPTTSRGRLIARVVGGVLTPMADNKETYVKKGYNYNDIHFACINLIVEKAILAPWAVYEVIDEQEYQKAKSYRKQLDKPGMLVKYQQSIKKALKPAEDKALQKLLDQPNSESTLSKHHSTLWRYKLSTGDYYERWTALSGGLNAGAPYELEVLPSQYMEILTNRAFPVRPVGYQLNAGGYGIQVFEKEDILHEAYPNLDWSFDGRHLYGMAPIKATLRRTQRNNSSQDNGAAAMQNGGQRGITWLKIPEVALKNMDIDGDFAQEQTDATKERYETMLQNPGTSGLTSFSGYEVGFTPIGLSPVDLDQMEMEQWDFRMIANVYGVPTQLLNDPANKIYNNMLEGEKALTLRCAVPLLNDREASFNRQLRKSPRYANSNLVISYDLSVYAELEENKKDQAQYLNTAWWIKANRKQEIAGETVDDDPMLDQYFVPSNLVPLRDLFVMGEPADITTDINNMNNQNANDFDDNNTNA